MLKFKIVLVAVCFLLVQRPAARAQYQLDEAQLEVTLRMIGHQLLLQDGDSSSRVLPVQKLGDSYQLPFESALGIVPDQLVKLVDSLVEQENIARGYRVEVAGCESNEVVYSFEMGRPGKTDLVPCRGRELPEACYTLLFTIIEYPLVQPNTHSSESKVAASESFGPWPLAVAAALLMLASGLWLFFRKKPAEESEIILALGSYGFDTRNMQLQLKGENTPLTAKEADLLLLLLQAANTTVERDTILQQVWGDEGDYLGRTLDVFISKLRKKLAADPGLKIVNVRGVGYKLLVNG